MFNYEQYMSALRWAMNAIGVYLGTKGWVDGSVWVAVTGLVLSAAPFIWGMIRHTKVGTLLAADSMPEVAGVITKPTIAGDALAKETPSQTVATAGTVAASAVAVR